MSGLERYNSCFGTRGLSPNEIMEVAQTLPNEPDTSALFHELERQDEDVPRILEEPQNNDAFLYIGGYYLPLSRAEGHSLIVGSTGTGKSLLTYPAIGHACATLGSRKGLVIVFDLKGEMYPLTKYFADTQNVPHYYFNLSDDRTNMWDVGKDCRGRYDLISELIEILVPVPESSDPFWVRGAQTILQAAALSLQKMKGCKWGLHDLYNACFARPESLRKFLLLTPANRPVVERIIDAEAGKTLSGILMQLSVSLQPLRMAAAMQYHTPPHKWVSLEEVVQSGGIVVIGQKPSTRKTTTPLLRAMFKRLSNVLLDLPDYSHFNTHLFIDELPFLGKNVPGLIDLLTFTRSKKCQVHITIQDITQLDTNYGTAQRETIVNNCKYKVLLRTNSPHSAQWASSITGTQKAPSDDFNIASNYEFSQNFRLVEKPRIRPDEFYRMPLFNRNEGLHSVFESPQTGVVRTHIPAQELFDLQPPTAQVPLRVDTPPYKFDFPLYDIGLKEFNQSHNKKEEFMRQWSGSFETHAATQAWDKLEGFAYDVLERLLRNYHAY